MARRAPQGGGPPHPPQRAAVVASVQSAHPLHRGHRVPHHCDQGARDNQRLLSLIEGVAFLHQDQRPRKQDHDGAEYIEATVDDYPWPTTSRTKSSPKPPANLSKPVRVFLDQMEEGVERLAQAAKTRLHDFWFTRRMVREATRVPDYLIKLYMRQIEDLEYIQVERAQRGGSFRYRLLPEKKAAGSLGGLPTPQELRKKVGVSGSKVEVNRKRS